MDHGKAEIVNVPARIGEHAGAVTPAIDPGLERLRREVLPQVIVQDAGSNAEYPYADFFKARIGAVLGMKVEDYYPNGKRWWVRLHEKSGKFHEVPAHHTLEAYLDAYLQASGIAGEPKTPLFRSANRKWGKLTGNALRRNNALDMVKRRATDAGFPRRICNHTFRATGITAYLEEGGTIEKAQAIDFHESPKTTKLYDRTSDAINLDEIERIRI
jgi:integrase